MANIKAKSNTQLQQAEIFAAKAAVTNSTLIHQNNDTYSICKILSIRFCITA